MDRKNKTWFWESNRGNKDFFASIEGVLKYRNLEFDSNGFKLFFYSN